MSKTYKDVVKLFDTTKAKKRERGASARFKREKAKQDQRLFKREVNFTNFIIQTSQED